MPMRALSNCIYEPAEALLDNCAPRWIARQLWQPFARFRGSHPLRLIRMPPVLLSLRNSSPIRMLCGCRQARCYHS